MFMKNRRKLLIIAAVISAMLVGGCSSKEEIAESKAVENTVVISKELADNFTSETAYITLNSEKYPVADVMNARVEERITSLKNEMREMAESAEDNPPMEFSYNAYQNIYETEGIISVVLDNANYSGGVHGYHWVEAFVAYKNSDEIIRLSDLMAEDYGVAEIKSIIKTEILSAPEMYFPDSTDYVDEMDIESSFYIDETGKLIIFFNPYEVAPYAAGIVRHEFDADKLKGIIKEEVYAELKSAENNEEPDIRLNGVGYTLENAPKQVEENGYYSSKFLPLEEIIEITGYNISAETNEADDNGYVSFSDLKVILSDAVVTVVSGESICIYY